MRTIATALILLAGTLYAAVPAIAQNSAVPTTTAASVPDADKKICRTITPTGSIMGKRFCLTKAEWKKLNDINAENAEAGLAGRRLRNQKGGIDP